MRRRRGRLRRTHRHPDRRQRLYEACANPHLRLSAGARHRQFLRLSGLDGQPFPSIYDHRRAGRAGREPVYYSEAIKYTFPARNPSTASASSPKSRHARAGLRKGVCLCLFQRHAEDHAGDLRPVDADSAAVPNSVLWLLTGGDNVDQRLRDLAKVAGVEPSG